MALSNGRSLEDLHRIKGPWSPEDDTSLQRLVQKYGPRNWTQISKGIQGRSGKSCKLHWCNQLKPGCAILMHNKVLSVVCLLQDEVDPMVSVIKVEKAPLESYADIGGLDAQIQEIKEVVALLRDHKPNQSDERKRIEDAGGFFMWAGTWRVAGVLAISQAFGDRILKQYVVAVPKIREEIINDGVEFFIMASDGLWDVGSNQEARGEGEIEGHVINRCP